MKLSLLFALIFWNFSVFAYQGELYSVEFEDEYSTAFTTIARERVCPDVRNINKLYGFRNYKLTYETVDVSGRPVYSMGLLIVPEAFGPFPMLVYQHGTLFGRSELPSSMPDRGEGMAMGYCFASIGYVAILPDYLGFGDSTGVHPYLHAQSEAVVARDMMRAAKSALIQLQVPMTDKLFIAGYSQGGHAAMSLLKLLEEDESYEFSVTAAAPMAGPYRLTETVEEILSNPSSHSAAEFAYLLMGLNPLYGFFTHLSDILRPEYVSTVAHLFDGSHTWDDVLAKLSIRPDQLITASALAVYRQPGSAFMEAIRDNENYNWVPRTPLRLYHGAGDREVPYKNSLEAYYYMASRGADVTLVNLGDSVDHLAGFPLAVGQAALWFETFNEQ